MWDANSYYRTSNDPVIVELAKLRNVEFAMLLRQMNPEELQSRTKSFALRIVKVFRNLPRNDEARVLGKQMLRSGTSVAANYRAVCRSRSKTEFIARLGIVVEEIDETVLWLEMLTESEILPAKRLSNLLKEANELLAIFDRSQLTAKGFSPNTSIRKSDNS